MIILCGCVSHYCCRVFEFSELEFGFNLRIRFNSRCKLNQRETFQIYSGTTFRLTRTKMRIMCFFLSLFTGAEFIIISFHLPGGALVLRKRPPNTGRTNSRCRVSDANMCVMKVGLGLASPIAWRVGALTSKYFFLFSNFIIPLFVMFHVRSSTIFSILITYIILCGSLSILCQATVGQESAFQFNFNYRIHHPTRNCCESENAYT